jgi:PAT family acetyl-CoA transporter-like MFS transporter 1
MTLVNTIANLGGTWPKFFVLYFVDLLTWKPEAGTFASEDIQGNDLESMVNISIFNDGYYVVGLLCVCVGTIWYLFNYKTLLHLQSVELKVWRIPTSDKDVSLKNIAPKHNDSKLE